MRLPWISGDTFGTAGASISARSNSYAAGKRMSSRPGAAPRCTPTGGAPGLSDAKTP
jgi:hypothetical protein